MRAEAEANTRVSRVLNSTPPYHRDANRPFTVIGLPFLLTLILSITGKSCQLDRLSIGELENNFNKEHNSGHG